MKQLIVFSKQEWNTGKGVTTSNPITRSRGFLALLIALLLIAAACGSDSSSDKTTTALEETRELVPVEMSLNNPILNPIISSLWIGKFFGWYEEEGIALSDPVGAQGVGDSTQRVAARRVDFAPSPPSIILTAAAQGRPLPVVSVYNWRRTGQYQLAVPVGSDITTLADVEGKTIGVSSLGDEGVFYAKAVLRELGLNTDNPDIISVGAAGQAAEALNQGQVDILALPGAQYALLETLGVAVELLPQPEFAASIFGNHIVTHPDFLAESSDIVAGYLRALTKSTLFFIENPEAAIRISYEMYPETIPSGLTVEEAVARSLVTAPAMIATLSFDQKACQQFGCQDQAEWEAYAAYVNAAVDDVTVFYTNEFIDAANDFDQVAFAEFARNYVFGEGQTTAAVNRSWPVSLRARTASWTHPQAGIGPFGRSLFLR